MTNPLIIKLGKPDEIGNIGYIICPEHGTFPVSVYSINDDECPICNFSKYANMPCNGCQTPTDCKTCPVYS